MPRQITPDNRVKELRERMGMSQKELALTIPVSRPTVSDWENQKKNPSGDRLKRLEEIFGVSTSVISGYDPVPNPVPVIFVDSGQKNAGREIERARALVERDPERGTLFAMATTADIMDVKRAIAILEALHELGDNNNGKE